MYIFLSRPAHQFLGYFVFPNYFEVLAAAALLECDDVIKGLVLSSLIEGHGIWETAHLSETASRWCRQREVGPTLYANGRASPCLPERAKQGLHFLRS